MGVSKATTNSEKDGQYRQLQYRMYLCDTFCSNMFFLMLFNIWELRRPMMGLAGVQSWDFQYQKVVCIFENINFLHSCLFFFLQNKTKVLDQSNIKAMKVDSTCFEFISKSQTKPRSEILLFFGIWCLVWLKIVITSSSLWHTQRKKNTP